MSIGAWIKRIIFGIGRAIRAFFHEIVMIFKKEEEQSGTESNTESDTESDTVSDTVAEEPSDEAADDANAPEEEAAVEENSGEAGADEAENAPSEEVSDDGENENSEGEAKSDKGENGNPEGDSGPEGNQGVEENVEADAEKVAEGGEASSEAGPEAEGSSGYRLSINWLPEGIPCDSGEDFGRGYPTSVTIHWIGAYPEQTPEIVRNWWETGGGEGSAHWVIKDDEVLQCWPTNKVCWHCGNSSGNKTSAGIEVIPMDTEGQFSVKSIATLKAVLDDYYPDLPLKRHYDWNGKDCPRYYVDEDRWAQLKTLLGRA